MKTKCWCVYFVSCFSRVLLFVCIELIYLCCPQWNIYGYFLLGLFVVCMGCSCYFCSFTDETLFSKISVSINPTFNR